MIARNKPAVCIGSGLNPGSAAQNRRNFVFVHVSYRAFLRARAFRPIMVDKPQTPARGKIGAVIGHADDAIMLAVNRAMAVFLGLA